jgi:hypothetical protein
MKHDQLIDFLLCKIEYVLCDNLPPAAQLPDAVAVKTICALISTPTAQTALEKGSDTECAFAVRAVNRVLSDQTRPPRETLNQLWKIMDGLDLSQSMQRERDPRSNFWAKNPPAR